jgi:homotetrameric cytidine deaminase
MARVNVECKAHDADPEATAARCVALGAVDHGVLHQRDTYFAPARGRLKLRDQGPEGAKLIAYRRPDATQDTESNYVLASTSEPEALVEALDAALGTTVVVVKRRRLFVWETVRIHLDEVQGLGCFVELEAVVGSGDGEPSAEELAVARAHVARLRAELAIADAALVAVGYSDLLLDGPQVLLRAADAAMRNAYAPYSQFKVGAALRSRSGAIYAAANVENAAYPQGQCAEASALGAMVAAGETAITAVAVVAERKLHCPPCGGCRQRLAEFGAADTPVHLGRPGQAPHTVTLAELLPLSFGRGDLQT